MGAPDAPLAGLRVLETATGVAGPYAGRLFALMGADVVKVEPPGGDPCRWAQVDHRPLPAGTPSPLFVHLNVGKRGPRGAGGGPDGLDDAVAWADVVIDDRVLAERAGGSLDPSRLDALDRRPVAVRLTAWGAGHHRSGAMADELLVQAASGVLSVTAAQFGEPVRFPGWQSQYLAGGYGVVGALLALAAGEHEVEVSWIDAMVTAVEAALATLLYDESLAVADGAEVPKARAIQDGAFPSGPFRCADGFVVPGTVRPLDWDLQCGIYGRDDLRHDERFSWRNRWQHRDELRAEIQPWYDRHTRAAIFEQALASGWAAAMVLTGLDALADPHLGARGFLRPLAGGTGAVVPGAVVPEAVVPGLSWRTPAGDEGRPVPFALTPTTEVGAGIGAPGPADPDRQRATAVGGPDDERVGPTDTPGPPPLGEVRILELTWAWAGPFVGRLLGAAGADVVRVETGSRPDGWRTPIRWRHTGLAVPAGVDPDDRTFDAAALFNSVNRNKRGVSIDLGTDDGRRAFVALLDAADVLVVNMTASVLADRGIDGAVDAAVERGLVAVTLPALGASGPFRSMPGYGTLTEGMGGFGARFGPVSDGAGISNTYYPDCVAGLHATVATLAGLARRRRTGRGALFDLSQQEAMWSQLGEGIVVASTQGRDIDRLGNAEPGWPGSGIVEDGEGGWTAVVDGTEVPVVDLRSAYRDGALEDRGIVELTDHPVAGKRAQLGLPVVLGGRRLSTTRPAPVFAQHTDEVLDEWTGTEPAQLARWREAGAVGSVPGTRR